MFGSKRQFFLRLRWRTIPLLVAGGALAWLIYGHAEAAGGQSGRGAALLFLTSFAFAWWLVPYADLIARRLNAVAHPGGRAINERVTPLLGGFAVFVPLLLALLDSALTSGETKAMGIALGAAVIFAMGAVDDMRGVRPRWKVLAQLLAGGWLVFSGFRIEALTLPGLAVPLELGILEIPFILFWVVLVTNAFNLIDGLDGLASTVALMAALGCFLLGAQPAAAVVLAGTCLGFLRHNLPRATIFLGDSGSMVLGFALAAFTLDVPAESNFPLALALLSYPLGDVALAIVRRFLRGKPLFAADRAHVHHKFLYLLGSPARALLGVATLAFVPLALGLVRPGIVSVSLTLCLWGLLAAAIVRLGQRGFERLFVTRRGIQRLYALSQYLRSMLGLADTEADVHMALRHLCEGMGVTFLSIREQRQILGRGDDPAAYPTEQVRLLDGAAAAWRGRPFIGEDAVAEERRILLTSLIREADARLREVRGEGVRGPDGSPPDGSLPGPPRPPRPARAS